MPVLIRNRQSGPTVFHDRINDIVIEWQGKGHPDGDDIQQVPDETLKNMNLMAAMRKGILEVVEPDDDTEELLARQHEAYNKRQKAVRDSTEALMDHQSERTVAKAQIASDEGEPEDMARMRNVGKVQSVIYDPTGLDEDGNPAGLGGTSETPGTGDEVFKPTKVVFDATPLPDQSR